MHVADMKAANENEPLSFVTLSAATARVISRLQRNENEQIEGPAEPKPGKETSDKAHDHLEYVERRAAEIASWERKISGRKV